MRIEFVFISVTNIFPIVSVTIPTKLALFVFVIVVTTPAGNTVLVVFVKSLMSETKVTPLIDKYLYFKYPNVRVISRRTCGPKLFKFKNLPAAISFAPAGLILILIFPCCVNLHDVERLIYNSILGFALLMV